MNDKAAVRECVSRLAELVKDNFPVKKVILFGSYAKGYAREDSDIDVAVLIDKIDGDFLSAETRLFQLRRNIDTRIEPVLIEDTDDFSGFLEEILKTGEIIYSS
ncbi:MAG: nucleotidyltransferase domain-containing protein [Desulfamplus sp.]|nr:nucleotidyltransferase domain-containing protein [Desulfamplus sp.]